MAILAAHLGEVEEARINEMTFTFFEDVLSELNYKLTFEAVANYAGNSFFEKSWDMIVQHHPLLLKAPETRDGGKPAALQQLAGLFG